MLTKLFPIHLFSNFKRCILLTKHKIKRCILLVKQKFMNYISSHYVNQNCSNRRLSAIGSIEMILILLVLVSLIVIFKSQITAIINSIFSSIREEIDGLL